VVRWNSTQSEKWLGGQKKKSKKRHKVPLGWRLDLKVSCVWIGLGSQFSFSLHSVAQVCHDRVCVFLRQPWPVKKMWNYRKKQLMLKDKLGIARSTG
jgi:hypothetical protein